MSKVESTGCHHDLKSHSALHRLGNDISISSCSKVQHLLLDGQHVSPFDGSLDEAAREMGSRVAKKAQLDEDKFTLQKVQQFKVGTRGFKNMSHFSPGVKEAVSRLGSTSSSFAVKTWKYMSGGTS